MSYVHKLIFLQKIKLIFIYPWFSEVPKGVISKEVKSTSEVQNECSRKSVGSNFSEINVLVFIASQHNHAIGNQSFISLSETEELCFS